MPDDPNDPNNPAPETQAQGAPEAQPTFMTKEDWAAERNSMFADMRKMMQGFSKAAPTPEPQSKATKHEPKAVDSGITRDELDQTLRLRDEFHRYTRSIKASDGALSRMQREFERERPENAVEWLRDYAADFGLSGSSEPKPVAPTRSTHPVSDGGAPAPATVHSDQQDPWRISDDDAKSILRRDGVAVAGARWKQDLNRALNGRRIRLK